MKTAKKKKRARSVDFRTILEMIFSLLLIPCGLAFAQDMSTEGMEPDINKAGLLMMTFVLLSLATLMRALAKRYRNQIPQRRLVDFIFSGAFLAYAAVICFRYDSLKVWAAGGTLFLISMIPGRVLSILRNRKWYKVLLNVILILVFLFYSCAIFVIDEPIMVMYFVILIMIMVAVRSFIRIMSVTFARLRLDLLRDIVRRTYAAEIIFGLILLILSFSWVLLYTDPGFEHYPDALWYCFAVVTTIGFGDITAVTVIGRALSVVLGIYGIIVVALITSIIVNFYGEMKKAVPEDEETAPEDETETALDDGGTALPDGDGQDRE